jgi:predicted extracellular nuclease
MTRNARVFTFLICLLAAAGLRLGAVGSGSVSLTAINTASKENFDSLASTGTSSTLPAGWFFEETGTNANTLYNTSTGSNNAGDTYSFGASGSFERAFGTLQSGSLLPTIGAAFTNNTGQTVTALAIAYTGEQWRLGTASRVDRLDFQYSLDATSLATGTWTGVSDLSFSSPNTSSAVGLLDGNAAANRTSLSSTITGLAIAPGSTFWIRWVDFNASGADDGLAVDDFSITPQNIVVPTPPSGTGTATPSTVTPGDPALLTVAVTPGVPPEAITSVTADLTAIGGAAGQPLFDDGTNGDVMAADGLFSFAVSVAFATTPGIKSLPFTVTDAAARTGAGAIALVVQAPPVITPIHDVQGSGDLSPFTGQMVTIEGIVTARRFNNGFFVQAPDAEVDSDAATSEGIFVFTSSAPPPAAAVGNRVRVTGTVQEFAPSTDSASPTETEIVSPTVIALSTGNPLPAAVNLTAANTDPAGPLDQLERFEGMRVHVDSLIVVAPTQGTVNEVSATASTNGVYFGVLPSIARPFREPGIELPDPLPVGSPCCIPRFDSNPERIRVDSNGQATFGANDTTEVMTGAVVTNITGVLDYGSRTYTILPDFGAQGTASGLHGFTAVAAAGLHQFTIGTANLERFFDTVNDPATSDAVLTATAYSNRLIKVSHQIRDVMNTPDVVGVEEVENIGVLQAIADQVNADSGDSVHYVAYLFEGNDIGGIDDGLLVNTLRVSVRDVHQEGKDTTYINPLTGQPEILNDRPPTVLQATIHTDADAPVDITVIANHLRSLTDVDSPTDGPRVRAKRLAQAEYLGHLIEGLQQQSASEPILAVGDFNAFEFSDGYVDVIGTIKGTPAPADQVVLSSTNVPNAGSPLVDLIERDSTPQRYSYSFNGSAQSLDHMLATESAVALFAGIQWGHSNADFPESFRTDFTRPERLSDHDPVVAYFTLPAMTTTAVTAAPNPAEFTEDIVFMATVSVPGGVASSGSVQFSDGAGFSANVPVSGGTAVVTISASSFGLGSHMMTAVYSGSVSFAASSGTTSFVVRDTTPPSRPVLTVSPSVLRPANNQLVDVVVNASSVDAADPSVTCSIRTIISSAFGYWLNNERKSSEPDFLITGPLTAELLSEKGKGPFDRIYLLFVTCQDDSGNVSAPGVAIVAVPHDRGER